MDKNIVRILSNSVVVSSLLFGKLSAAKQTEILANGSGKPIVFVDSFSKFTNKNDIIKKLLAGEDVSVELEFNEISLTPEETKMFTEIRPVIERIRGAKLGSYEWRDPNGADDAKLFGGFNFWRDYLTGTVSGTSLFRTPSGYNVTRGQLEKIWDIASRLWFDGTKPDKMPQLRFNYESRTLKVNADGIILGCQSASRELVEALARKYKLEPNIG